MARGQNRLLPPTPSGNARYKARDLLARVHVRATVERLREEEQQRLKKRYQVDNERVMQELIKVAFFDLGKLFDDQGTIKLPPELDQDTAAAIASIDIVARKDRDEMIRVIKIRMANKLAALDKIALMLGMYQQSNEQQPPNHQPPQGASSRWCAIGSTTSIPIRKKARTEPNVSRSADTNRVGMPFASGLQAPDDRPHSRAVW